VPTQNRTTRDIPSVFAADLPLQTKPAPAIKPVKSVRRSRAIKVLPTSPSLAPLDEPEAMDLMENYRAQIAHCDRLKREMDAIQSAIFQTKREIASLHKSGFDTGDAIDVHGELDAIVGGTEQATQTILAAAEAIETANAAINDAATIAQRQVLSARIGDNITAIFEACNFQDLTGQRIGKVMATMGAIESHISTMMEIWGGVAAIKACAPEATERDADQRLLNGPKLHHSDEYVSQNDIDAMFD
jgi:chemotaxis protein CheZ